MVKVQYSIMFGGFLLYTNYSSILRDANVEKFFKYANVLKKIIAAKKNIFFDKKS